MAVGSQLGQVLVDAGVLDEAQHEGYTARARREQKSLPILLMEDGLCSDEEIAKTLSIHLGLPFVQLDQIRIPGYVAKILTREQSEKYWAIPVSFKREGGQDVLYVAFLDPTSDEILQEIQQSTHRTIRPVVSTYAHIRAAIDRYQVPLKGRKSVLRARRQARELEEDNQARQLTGHGKPVSTEYGSSEEIAAPPVQDIEVYEDLGLPEVPGDQAPPSPPPSPISETPEIEVEAVDEIPDGADVVPVDAPRTTPTTGIEVADPTQDDDESVEAEIDLELDFSEEDLGLDATSATSEPDTQPVPEAKADIDPMDDFELEAELEMDSPPATQTDSTENSGMMEFLSLDLDKLGAEDNDILRRQSEAKSVRQRVAFGVENPDKKEQASEKSNDARAQDETDAFDNFDLDLDSSNEKPTDKADSWTDDMDLDFELGDENDSKVDLHDSGITLASSDKEGSEGVHLDEDEEDFDAFDFDIPEAPEFDGGSSSGSFASVQSDEQESAPNSSDQLESYSIELEDSSPSIPAVNGNNETDDWSLDIDALIESRTDTPIVQEEPVSDFEDAARKLDSLLSDMDEAPSSEVEREETQVDPAIIEQLLKLAQTETKEEGGSDEDVEFIYSFLNGKLSGESIDDPRMQKLQTILSAMTQALIEKGVIEEPDFLKAFFEKQLNIKD